ncbi:MAG: regulatory protein RecX [Burkholderiales bacterium]
MRDRRPARGGDAAPPRPATPPKTLAVRWLARRDYSRAELTQRLRQRGVADVDIERALDELAAAGYLSDARYAQTVVAQRAGRYGKRAIAHTLRERGIPAAEAADALAPLAATDELADAQALWQQRFGAAPANDREKARQVRFLQSRGYGLSVALRVLRAAGARGDDET